MNRMVWAGGLVVAILGLSACVPTNNEVNEENQSFTVFAAASLSEVFEELIDDFRGQGTFTVETVYDGSSTLVMQLQEGADADVLATANQTTMEEAISLRLVDGAAETFAKNSLVIAVPKGNPLEITTVGQAVTVDYAACARPVPCGEATQELFERTGLDLAPISQEQNVSAVANRVVEGDVDVGFIYSTDFASRPELEAVIPPGEPVENTYPVAALTDSARAHAFIEYLLTDEAGSILQNHGFGIP